MKKFKYLLFAFLCMALFPIAFVNAAEKVNVYVFKSSTCPHCAEAMEFFEELEEDSEYSEYFNFIPFETNGSSSEIKDNISLAEKVAKHFGNDFDGVPLIVIGEKYYEGYVSSMDTQLKDQIKSCYDNSCEDIVAGIQNGTLKSSSFDTVIVIGIIVVLVGGVSYFIYLARKNPEEKEQVVEEMEDTTEQDSSSKKEANDAKKKITNNKKDKKESDV